MCEVFCVVEWLVQSGVTMNDIPPTADFEHMATVFLPFNKHKMDKVRIQKQN